jgi:hypothetical protein
MEKKPAAQHNVVLGSVTSFRTANFPTVVMGFDPVGVLCCRSHSRHCRKILGQLLTKRHRPKFGQRLTKYFGQRSNPALSRAWSIFDQKWCGLTKPLEGVFDQMHVVPALIRFDILPWYHRSRLIFVFFPSTVAENNMYYRGY